MFELLGWFFLVLLALDVVAWTLVLTVAGLWRLMKRFFLALNPYRANPTL